MASATDIEQIAKEMKDAQDRRIQIEPFSSRRAGLTLGDAYAVARLIHDLRTDAGSVAVGRKLGFTNAEMWSRYGVREPIWAYVYDSTVEQLQTPDARCPIRAFAEPKVEPEIVLHFGQTPPPGGDVDDILACVDWIAHGFELVQSHFPGWRFQASDTVADGALHAKLLVGPTRPIEDLGPTVIADLERFEITLSCNGRIAERGRGANALGNPLLAIGHLTTTLASQPGAAPLVAGELVTTGTLTAAMPAIAGQTWTTGLAGIGLPGLTLSLSE